MNEVLDRIEHALQRAIAERIRRRRARRRVLRVAAAATLLVAAVAGAAGVSERGPVAELFGVDEGDQTLQIARPVERGERARVRAQSPSGQRWTFAIFQSRSRLASPPGSAPERRDESFCFTPIRERARRVSGLGCSPARYLAREIRREGLYSGAWGGGTGLAATHPVYGLVPADVQRVRARAAGRRWRVARLSAPFRVKPHVPPVRAFLAVVESRGDITLSGWTRLLAEADLADGTRVRDAMRVAVGFPLVPRTRPLPAADRVRLTRSVRGRPWRMVAYTAKRGILCTSASPRPLPVIREHQLQCSAPLAIADAVTSRGYVAYPSDSYPPRAPEKPASYTVRGYVRADAREVFVTDQLGRRWRAAISEPWTRVRWRPRELRGVRGPARARLSRVPRNIRLRAFLVALKAPPLPDVGRGLRVTVRR